MTTRMTFALAAALLIGQQALAQPNTADPALALWLDATTLALGDGDPVSLWTDSSNHGTTFEATATSASGAPAEQHPGYVASNPDFNGMPTVNFERTEGGANDPNVPFSGGFDRMFQTNNLGAGDPLDIGDGSDLSVFIVYLEDTIAPNGESTALGYSSVFTKRGTGSAVYSVANAAGSNNYFTISYGGDTAFQASPSASTGQAQLTTLTIEEAGVADPYTFTENGVVLTSISGGGGFVTPRNPTVPEAAALGGHSQACCGDGEWFSGDIAEVIVYDRLLSSSETAGLNAYLGNKYNLTIVPEPCSAALMLFAGLFAVRRRR